MGLNILTIDIEDWYLSYDSSQISYEKWPDIESRVEQSTHIFLQLLEKHQQKATFFVLGWIAQRHPGLIKEIADAGHEIGYHSFVHALPVNQGKDLFEADLIKGIELLRTITGKAVEFYRAPMFSLCNDSSWTIPILLKHGIKVSSSYKAHNPINDHKIHPGPFYFETGGQQLLEFPLNRLKLPAFNWVYTGSGYFRILPLWLIKSLFDSSNYNMTYFHPRDFDKNLPASRMLPMYRNWMNRVGNASTYSKLESLLESSPFLSVGDAAAKMENEDLPVVKLR